MIRFLSLLLAIVCLERAAMADELRPGYLEFTQTSPTHWTLIWKSPVKGGFTPAMQPSLPESCASRQAPVRAFTNGTVVTTFEIVCTGNVAGSAIGLDNFELAQSDVLLRVAPLGRPVQALRLTPAEPHVSILKKPDRWQVARTYFMTGIDHIIFGYDHLLFVIALVLLLSGLWTVVKAVTAFTVAHSLTLIGTTLGVMGLPSRPVESLIALSILFLAVEIIKQKPGEPRLSERIPWVVAFGFGLLHGFGFAGALQEVGLPETDVPTALLTFNLGVEAGQVAIVVLSMAILRLLRMAPAPVPILITKTLTYIVGITASFWFIERSLS